MEKGKQTMHDVWKVIKALDVCIGHGRCVDCSYCLTGVGFTTMDCRKRMMKDALALLKESRPKKGHWVFHQDECGYVSFDCSVCGMWFDTDNKIFRRRISSFCPNCGADMREGEHDA